MVTQRDAASRVANSRECFRPTMRSDSAFSVLLIRFTGSCPARGQSVETSGYKVKTAFLFNFAKFIEWPASSFATPQSPFAICVLGQDPFGSILTDTLQGKMIGDPASRCPAIERQIRGSGAARLFSSVLRKAHTWPKSLRLMRGAKRIAGRRDATALRRPAGRLSSLSRTTACDLPSIPMPRIDPA